MGLEMADGTILTPNSTGADVDAGAGGGFNVKGEFYNLKL